MNRSPLFRALLCVAASLILSFGATVLSQEQRPASGGDRAASRPATEGQRPRLRGRPRGPMVVSPEVSQDRHVTFRIFAPQAQKVELSGGDIPGNSQRSLSKSENGVWEITLGPVGAGAYRYTFNVDGVPVVDPRNPSLSQSNNNAWSVVYVPGSEFMDAKDVPHGAVAAVYYQSSSLGRLRRMHVYTPPGYESGSEKYPVFYLLHGAGDSDDSWTSVGRANFILDNLIAQKKVRPMIVVMPAGHTGSLGFFGQPSAADEFDNDFLKDLMPYVEGHYRVLADANHRAIAGLSMGGAQTLSIAFAHPKDFAYVGVFSSGLFRDAENWEKQHASQLDEAGKSLKLVWFKTGRSDFLLSRSQATVELLRKHGVDAQFQQSDGGHTWINWRNYLDEFAPQLFKE